MRFQRVLGVGGQEVRGEWRQEVEVRGRTFSKRSQVACIEAHCSLTLQPNIKSRSSMKSIEVQVIYAERLRKSGDAASAVVAACVPDSLQLSSLVSVEWAVTSISSPIRSM